MIGLKCGFIAKIITLSEVVLWQLVFSFIDVLLLNIFSGYSSTWTGYVNMN